MMLDWLRHEDLISPLPDHLLISILSLLPLKDAAKTSILSKRWKLLWTHLPCLDFDRQDLLGEFRSETGGAYKKPLFERRRLYINWVNKVLESCTAPTVQVLRVRFDLDESSGDQIDEWILFAMEKKVHILILELNDSYGFQQHESYNFPTLHYMKENWGSLDYCCWHSLTTLILDSVNVTGKVLEDFLSKCQLIETLVVRNTFALVNLKVSGQSLTLKHLEIVNCFHLKSLEISAPDLVSLKYEGGVTSLSFTHIPKLVKAYFGGRHASYVIANLFHLRSYLSQLHSLSLFPALNYHVVDNFPILENLKELEITVYPCRGSFLVIVSKFMNAFPHLRKFSIKLDWDPGYEVTQQIEVEKCPHENIKVVEFVGFISAAIDLELVMFVVENAVSLEKIIIDVRDYGRWWFDSAFKYSKKALRNVEYLRTMLPPRVEVIIVV